MKAYLLRKLTFFHKNPGIDLFHYYMFHGCVRERHGQDALWVNAYHPPQIMQPSADLIFADQVRQGCAGVPGLEFARIDVEKIFLQRYESGDFSHFDVAPLARNDVEILALLERQKHRADLAVNIPRYFGLKCAHLSSIASQFDEKVAVTWDIGPTRFDQPVTAEVSEEMFRRHSIIQANGFLLGEEMFACLDKHLNREFFLVAEANLPEKK